MRNDDSSLYPEEIVSLAKKPRHFGRMNDATGSAYVKGPCGEEMEFYLIIKDGVIEKANFYTEGCIATVVCGSITAGLVSGKSIKETLGISPKEVIDSLKGLPEDYGHCSILAVSTFYRAIANYLFRK